MSKGKGKTRRIFLRTRCEEADRVSGNPRLERSHFDAFRGTENFTCSFPIMIEPGARIRYNLMTMLKRNYSIVVEEESVHGYKKGRPGCYHRAV